MILICNTLFTVVHLFGQSVLSKKKQASANPTQLESTPKDLRVPQKGNQIPIHRLIREGTTKDTAHCLFGKKAFYGLQPRYHNLDV